MKKKTNKEKNKSSIKRTLKMVLDVFFVAASLFFIFIGVKEGKYDQAIFWLLMLEIVKYQLF